MAESKITEMIVEDLRGRTETGFKEYGTTMDREDLTQQEWMQHLYEELLDSVQYLKKLIELKKRENASKIRSDKQDR